jgi:hypothetical protein
MLCALVQVFGTDSQPSSHAQGPSCPNSHASCVYELWKQWLPYALADQDSNLLRRKTVSCCSSHILFGLKELI